MCHRREERNETNALIAVRNAFAHSGALSERNAAKLLDRWQGEVASLVADGA